MNVIALRENQNFGKHFLLMEIRVKYYVIPEKHYIDVFVKHIHAK